MLTHLYGHWILGCEINCVLLRPSPLVEESGLHRKKAMSDWVKQMVTDA